MLEMLVKKQQILWRLVKEEYSSSLGFEGGVLCVKN
jgi:hypothetical protein